MRDLQDSLERENDLKEQMEFRDQELRTLKRKLSDIEGENESLTLQVRVGLHFTVRVYGIRDNWPVDTWPVDNWPVDKWLVGQLAGDFLGGRTIGR